MNGCFKKFSISNGVSHCFRSCVVLCYVIYKLRNYMICIYKWSKYIQLHELSICGWM